LKRKRITAERHYKNVGTRTRITFCCVSLGYSELSIFTEDSTEIFTVVKPAKAKYWFGWMFCCGTLGNVKREKV